MISPHSHSQELWACVSRMMESIDIIKRILEKQDIINSQSSEIDTNLTNLIKDLQRRVKQLEEERERK